ncbi:AMED_5909 family protein [Actinosynnema sp. CS-041913]|uniref:AMED_5909 family protein n=1 Tax=Actinosynnema sp. CS-041913 TaxID=3239917 RepID=UPI003D9293D6
MDARWMDAMSATTLKDAHEFVEQLMPAPNATPEVWREFHCRAVGVYERIADVDRGHHHEALYWVARERAKGEQVARSDSSGAVDRSGRTE